MTTFHPFSCLPYELRMQIWEATVEPRVVNCEFIYKSPWEKGPTRPTHITSSTPVPAVLQACQEARNHGLYQKCFSEIAVPEYGSQYVWANLDIDIIDIGKSMFESFKPVAPLIHRLKFARKVGTEYFDRWEVEEIRDFINAKEIWILPLDGLMQCVGLTDDHYFPCGEENVFYIDPKNSERVFRGDKGEQEIDDLCEKWRSENEDFVPPHRGWVLYV